jgi:hypothetical protein
MLTKVCDDCPCFNWNSEYGSKCNLGYIIEVGKDGYSSDVCELESIRYGGKYEFRPTLRAVDPPSALVSAADSENSAGN